MKSTFRSNGALLLFIGLLAAPSASNGGEVAVEKKDTSVVKNDRIDNEDARAGAAERVELIDDGGITMIQTQTYVPGKDSFKPFEGFPTHVDIFLDPSGFSESRDKDSAKAVQFSGLFGIFTVGDYPLQGEGNILVIRGGGKGQGQPEPPPEKHWAEKVSALVPDLVIHHGLAGTGGKGGDAVSEELEDGDTEGHGAFTVANLNDTDGDEKIDAGDGDTSVTKNGEKGHDELDLMLLELPLKGVQDVADLPHDLQTHDVVLTVDGAVLLWEESTKEKLVARPYKWKVKDMPRVVWVEAIAVSGKVRDISIEMAIGSASDKVLATGVWCNEISFRSGKPDQPNGANGPSPDVKDEKKYRDVYDDQIRPHNWGPIDYKLLGADGNPKAGVRNAVEIGFEALPASLFEEKVVFFDIGRRRESRTWHLAAPGTPWVFKVNDPFPVSADAANDNPNEVAEDDIPDVSDHMYSCDATGETPDDAHAHEISDQSNFREFVRVAIGDPIVDVGQTGNGVVGSRASAFVDWYSRLSLIDNGEGKFIWNPAKPPPAVGPGKVPLPDKPL